MKRKRETTPPNPFGITQCEAAALDAIIATGSHKAAARRLHLSHRTVEDYSQAARKKLAMHGRTSLYLIEWDRWRRANPAPATIDRASQIVLLKAGARSGHPGTLALAAQLAGAAPCGACGYVWNHCRCATPTPKDAR